MFARFAARGTRSNQLFLHEAMDRKLTAVAPIFRWFRDQLVVLHPESVSAPLETAGGDREDLRNYVTEVLKLADTGIVGLRSVAVPAASLPVHPEFLEEINSSVTADEKSGVILMAPTGQRFTIFRKDDELMASRVLTHRTSAEGEEVLFEMTDESDGTLRLFDLAPSFYDLGAGRSAKVYVMDELDRSMHPHLTRALLEHFLSTRSRDTRSQLIFTTHDVTLLDQGLFRRDEIWFLNRGAHGETEMESLSSYRERHDRDILRSYLDGRYSGVPGLRPFGSLRAPAADQPELFPVTSEPAGR